MKRKLVAIVLVVVFLFTAGISASADSVIKAPYTATGSDYNSHITLKPDKDFKRSDYTVHGVALVSQWSNTDKFTVSALSKSKKGKYVASKKASVFHYTRCHYVDNIKSKNRVYYSTKKKAKADGKRPCKICKP
jgi:hypothetical protein